MLSCLHLACFCRKVDLWIVLHLEIWFFPLSGIGCWFFLRQVPTLYSFGWTCTSHVAQAGLKVILLPQHSMCWDWLCTIMALVVDCLRCSLLSDCIGYFCKVCILSPVWLLGVPLPVGHQLTCRQISLESVSLFFTMGSVGAIHTHTARQFTICFSFQFQLTRSPSLNLSQSFQISKIFSDHACVMCWFLGIQISWSFPKPQGTCHVPVFPFKLFG